MILRSLKWGLAGTGGLILIGGLLLGRDFFSYARHGARSVRQSVKENVPIEFELDRARRMVDDIIPELKNNIQTICREQVDVAHLRQEIEAAREHVDTQRDKVSSLRNRLSTQQVSFEMGHREVPRQQVVDQLSSRLGRLKEAKEVLESKERLLEMREKSLAAAEEMLSKTKSRKVELEERIESLVAQHRLLQAQSATSEIQIDNSKLAQTEKLMTDIAKRLDTAQQVLTYETEMILDDSVASESLSEEDLLVAVDAELGNRETALVAYQSEDRNSDAELETTPAEVDLP